MELVHERQRALEAENAELSRRVLELSRRSSTMAGSVDSSRVSKTSMYSSTGRGRDAATRTKIGARGAPLDMADLLDELPDAESLASL